MELFTKYTTQSTYRFTGERHPPPVVNFTVLVQCDSERRSALYRNEVAIAFKRNLHVSILIQGRQHNHRKIPPQARVRDEIARKTLLYRMNTTFAPRPR